MVQTWCQASPEVKEVIPFRNAESVPGSVCLAFINHPCPKMGAAASGTHEVVPSTDPAAHGIVVVFF